MRIWLLTLSSQTDIDSILQELSSLGIDKVEGAGTVSIGEDVIIEVIGPEDLPNIIRNHSLIKSVHPASDMSFYDKF